MVTGVDGDRACISFLGPVVLKRQGLCPGQETKCPQCVVKMGSDLRASRNRGEENSRLFSPALDPLRPPFHVPGPCSRVE